VLAVVLIVLGVALVAMYLSWTAGRLDRLHTRTEAARAALDAQLVRRAVAAIELARAAAERGLLAPADADGLIAAGQRARAADAEDRVSAEEALGRILRQTFTERVAEAVIDETALRPLAEALDDAMTRLVLARRFLAVAVHDTRALRERRLVRILRLAGHAQLPDYFDIDDTPAPFAISTVSGQR